MAQRKEIPQAGFHVLGKGINKHYSKLRRGGERERGRERERKREREGAREREKDRKREKGGLVASTKTVKRPQTLSQALSPLPISAVQQPLLPRNEYRTGKKLE